MKNTLKFLSIPFAAILLSGCTTTHQSNLPPAGLYKENSTTVDPNGTRVDTETNTDVFYDADGKKKAIVNKKTTADPKGLFNKSTAESTKVVE